MLKSGRGKRGLSLVEIIVVTALTVVLVGTMTSLLLSSMGIWAARSGQTQADTEAALAMQQIVRDLSQALTISIDGAGQSISYTLPARLDGEYAFRVPVEPERDATGQIKIHSLYVDGTALYSSDRERPMIASMPGRDPDTGETYAVFLLVAGTENCIQVTLVSSQRAGKGTKHTKTVQQVLVRNLH